LPLLSQSSAVQPTGSMQTAPLSPGAGCAPGTTQTVTFTDQFPAPTANFPTQCGAALGVAPPTWCSAGSTGCGIQPQPCPMGALVAPALHLPKFQLSACQLLLQAEVHVEAMVVGESNHESLDASPAIVSWSLATDLCVQTPIPGTPTVPLT